MFSVCGELLTKADALVALIAVAVILVRRRINKIPVITLSFTAFSSRIGKMRGLI